VLQLALQTGHVNKNYESETKPELMNEAGIEKKINANRYCAKPYRKKEVLEDLST
jgi:hypothetical protein